MDSNPLNITYVIKITLEVFIILFVGLFIARCLDDANFTYYLNRRFSHLLKFFNLPEQLTLAFFTGFFAGFAAEALVATYIKEGKLPKKDMIPSVMLLDLPIYISFMPLLLAIVLPLAQKAGLIYLGLQLIVSATLTLTALLIFKLKYKNKRTDLTQNDRTLNFQKINYIKNAKLALNVSIRVISLVFVALLIVSFITKAGTISKITAILNNINFAGLNPKTIPIAVAHSFHISASSAMVGTLLQNHQISIKEAVIGMMWGSIIGMPIRGVRLVIPRYSGLYGPKNGLKLWIINQGYRASVAFLVTLIINLT